MEVGGGLLKNQSHPGPARHDGQGGRWGGGGWQINPPLWGGGQSPAGEQPPAQGLGGGVPVWGWGLDPGLGGLSVGHARRAGDAHAAAPSGSYSLQGRAS